MVMESSDCRLFSSGMGGEVLVMTLGSTVTGGCFHLSSTHPRPLWAEYAVLQHWEGTKKAKRHTIGQSDFFFSRKDIFDERSQQ